MLPILFTGLACLASLTNAQTTNDETILGVYMFHRHGDRTPKSFPPANLTDLGYAQVHASGQYYRSRYIAYGASYRVNGINSDVVKQNQITVSAPSDVVLMNSAQGFLQGLYPPVGSQLSSNTLRNGSTVVAPMDGYQLIPVSQVATGSGSENSAWLQSASGCQAAIVSSNNYLSSAEYKSLYDGSADFYQSLLPVINGTFTARTSNFLNAYSIYDLINVAQIHNTTNYNNSELITSSIFKQLSSLANAHEWGLAYNSSDDTRAIAGKVLAAQVVQFLNGTLMRTNPSKLAIQFGAYGTFMSFFGLADLPAVSDDFKGIVDYTSSMAFELFTNGSSTGSGDAYVRFIFHNGTASAQSPPSTYPLFGSKADTLRWADFAAGMEKFAVGSTAQWCTACGNYTGTCAAYDPNGEAKNSAAATRGGNGLSAALNGLIGAMVTLAVMFAVTLVLLLSGFRLVNKRSLVAGRETTAGKEAS